MLLQKISDDTSSKLSPLYKVYVLYECILINLVGFVTLFFQCSLQSLEGRFLNAFPNVSRTAADAIFGHFWLKENLNCATREAHCLTFMIAGWLMIAGVLQVFINFDDFRRLFFGRDADCPRGIKKACMYAFFVCDWYWVVLMIYYRDVIGWQQIVGSAVDIAFRLYFVTNPDRMFIG